MLRVLRRYLVTGLVIWVPIIVTVVVIRFLIDLTDRSLLLLPDEYHPSRLLGMDVPGLGILLTFILLLVTGLFAANFFGRRLVDLGEKIMARIPLIRSVYSGAKQVAETVFSERNNSFRQVLLVEYPRRGVWCLAFQTSREPGEVHARSGEDVLCCFVPTTPNPTSGFIIFVPSDEAIRLDMSVDDALKMIISLGMVVPQWHDPEDARASLAPHEGGA